RDARGLPLQVIHLTGERDDNLAAINYQREGIPARLGEISQFGLPSILIPFPFASERHQHRNAEVFRDAGAAEMVEEKEADPAAFALLVRNLLEDGRRRERMAAAASGVLPRGAAEAVAEVLEEAAR
ncbi:MAG: undecaprenyldiphospho-muramoylpentapeptide beta-N-acetylglucosaminyltransferase, partial [Planctomycetia bacterium]|nr:undecaprenyldiphospho-muramoylpentapeptide beta-N-acetylglucosaminyltransferase [Planctomycetia bacterium]